MYMFSYLKQRYSPHPSRTEPRLVNGFQVNIQQAVSSRVVGPTKKNDDGDISYLAINRCDALTKESNSLILDL